MKKKCKVYIWTGTGSGKTTSALGVALRQVGHRQKVLIVQFMKGRKYIGEYKVAARLKPYYNIYQFGREGWVNLSNPSVQDIKLAHKGLEFAVKETKRIKPRLLILDEINLATAAKLLTEKEVLDALDRIPAKTIAYLTGRYAPLKLILRADYVTEFVTLKRPEKITATKGIEW